MRTKSKKGGNLRLHDWWEIPWIVKMTWKTVYFFAFVVFLVAFFPALFTPKNKEINYSNRIYLSNLFAKYFIVLLILNCCRVFFKVGKKTNAGIPFFAPPAFFVVFLGALGFAGFFALAEKIVSKMNKQI